MVTFESNIGSSSFDIPEGKSFQVPDATKMTPQEALAFRQQFMNQGQQPTALPDMQDYRLEQQRIAEANRLSALTEAKRRVEVLVGIGRTHREVKVVTDKGLITFTLRSLKGREQRELEHVIEKSEKTTEIVAGQSVQGITPTGMQDIKVCSLKYALYAIDGTDVDIVLGVYDKSPQERSAMRQAFIEEMDNGLTNHLFFSYRAMLDENRERFSIKSEADAKEVAELIKKSGEGA